MAYKNTSSASMFDKEYTLEELSTMGKTLPRLKEILDFEQFRLILELAFSKENRKSNVSRKPFDPVLMMRVFFFQRLYGLNDKQIEYQVKDRMSFREFIGIGNVDNILDENTVWKYKDMLAKTGTWDRLFAKFTECLDTLGLIVTEGKIIDASFVIAPRQRTGREEDKWTKENKGLARAGRYDKTDLARNATRTWMPDG